MLITVEHDKLFLHACSRVNGQTNILHRVADTSTNRRQGFLCRRKVSMEQTADRAEVVAVDHYFSSLTEQFWTSLPSDTGKQTDDGAPSVWFQ